MSYIKRLRKKIGNEPIVYPGIRAIIENENKEVLLVKRNQFEFWGLPAGGIEIGESIEDCLIREVKEETGLNIKSFKVIGIASNPMIETVKYPNGDIIQALSIVFHSDEWEGVLKPDEDEIGNLGFFKIDKIPIMLANEKNTLLHYQKFKEDSALQLH